MTDLIDVVFIDFPVDTHLVASEHAQELQREFQLIRIGSAERDLDVPTRLVTLVDTITEQFRGVSDPQTALIEQARRDGKACLPELQYSVPAAVADASIALSRMLDECDEYCRRGDALLTLATPDEVLAYRRWYLGEFVAQTRGGSPLPWPAADRDALIASPRLRGEPDG